MNKFFTLLVATVLGTASFGQTIFESDISDWTDEDPDGFMGSRTNIDSENVIENMIGVEHGTSSARLVNADGSHKRFTTTELGVTGGETYNIEMWVTGADGCELRTAFYDATNDNYLYPNSYLDLFAETGGDLEMLMQTINIPASCTDGEFIFSIRNTDELVGIILDSVAIGVGEPIDPEEASIYDIQYSEDADFISPLVDEIVTTRGIVTGVFMFGGDEGRFFIQDGAGAWNGVYVYDNTTPVELGDSVIVTGTVSEFFTLTELTSVVSINVVSSGNPLPAAVEVSTADVANEEYEGVLVKVVDAKCTNDDAGFGAFEVNDGTGVRLVDDEIFSYTPAIDTYYNITGVTFLSFGDTKIYPRMLSDIEVTGYAGLEDLENAISLFPNPASHLVNINVSPTATVAIYNMAGELVYTVNGSANTIDVSAFDAGIYQVTVTDNNAVSTERLMVK